MKKAIAKDDRTVTKWLLAAGMIAGPLFLIVPLIEIFTRPGFDITRHAISMLSLGNLGWIQITTFILTGLLTVACAVGMRLALRGSRGGTWGPLLVGAFGVGMIAAGIFATDPGLGFPPGAEAGIASTMSWHAILHSIAFFTSFLSVIAACFVFVRRFASIRQRGWVMYCAATGVAIPAFIVLGMGSVVATGVAFFITGWLAWIWVVAITLRLSTEKIQKI